MPALMQSRFGRKKSRGAHPARSKQYGETIAAGPEPGPLRALMCRQPRTACSAQGLRRLADRFKETNRFKPPGPHPEKPGGV